MTQQKEPSSSFARAALALDAEFQEFERLAGELERLSLESDRGLDRGLALLAELNATRERIGPASAELGRALGEAQERVAHAAGVVQAREGDVTGRQEMAKDLLARYQALAGMVQQISTAVGKLKKPDGSPSPEDQAALAKHLPEITEKMGVLVDEARRLMDDARAVNMKTLERNADSLRQSLQSARHRFGQLAGDLPTPSEPPTVH